MGSIRPSNIKRISEELVDNNKDLFNEDFPPMTNRRNGGPIGSIGRVAGS